MTIYAIGDLHGHLDLLKKLRNKIVADASGVEHTVVFIGDYIDRGPDSKGVINYLMSKPFPGFKHVFLKGNHEDMMQRVQSGDWRYSNWMYNGGEQTLDSYTRDGEHDPRKNDFNKHLAWMRNLRPFWFNDTYFFVHAGINPDKTWEDAWTDPDSLLWIRDKFLNSDKDFGRIIVHGHTPTKEPERKFNRINIDTGAFYYGTLTAVALEDDKAPRFIQVN